MKPRITTIFLPIIAALVLAAFTSAEQICYDHPNPMNPLQREKVPCELVPADTVSRRDYNHRVHNRRDQLSYNGSDSFQITFTCRANATVCAKAKNAFQQAGTIITGVLKLSVPIIVNATFYSFCKESNDCGTANFITLEYHLDVPHKILIPGGSYPARTMVILDDDGLNRYYPQALVKQLNLKSHPTYGPYDITSVFNADAPFFFEYICCGVRFVRFDCVAVFGLLDVRPVLIVHINPTTQEDGTITAVQSDFLFVILHEFMHGLGFYSNWNDYINQVPQALTPDVTPLDTRDPSQFIDLLASVTFSGFYESVFDRYMVLLPSLTPTTQLTRTLNGFAGGIGAKFSGYDTFFTQFIASPQYQTAVSMFKTSITSYDLGFMPTNGSTLADVFVLETSLNPFAEGSSISHADYKTYTNTSDFLMRYMEDRGVTIRDAVNRGGGGPIGPKLIRVLETLGYATISQPNPDRNTGTFTGTNASTTTSGNTAARPGGPGRLWAVVVAAVVVLVFGEKMRDFVRDF
ncbi:LOW QUALITY PROTEIN: hypothetical protein BC936DRAFT_145596 [Jimgerdemannia flammicorona]|uniref:Sequence orphan n=1 Tax=Jimgerdemannia flammicorona TaxID=994334 RepID=A0A433DAA4_9FUNG|nr:LOW QUALITY PROTEIN: hypothetical protein BC936DRAFT_145596 [Jimgerdemannia flammicorona]